MSDRNFLEMFWLSFHLATLSKSLAQGDELTLHPSHSTDKKKKNGNKIFSGHVLHNSLKKSSISSLIAMSNPCGPR